jgi:hypothetical protein
MAEYQVFECSTEDQFEFLAPSLLETDNLAEAHSCAYDLWKQFPAQAFMIYQPRLRGSRGGYGIPEEE